MSDSSKACVNGNIWEKGASGVLLRTKKNGGITVLYPRKVRPSQSLGRIPPARAIRTQAVLDYHALKNTRSRKMVEQTTRHRDTAASSLTEPADSRPQSSVEVTQRHTVDPRHLQSTAPPPPSAGPTHAQRSTESSPPAQYNHAQPHYAQNASLICPDAPAQYSVDDGSIPPPTTSQAVFSGYAGVAQCTQQSYMGTASMSTHPAFEGHCIHAYRPQPLVSTMNFEFGPKQLYPKQSHDDSSRLNEQTYVLPWQSPRVSLQAASGYDVVPHTNSAGQPEDTAHTGSSGYNWQQWHENGITSGTDTRTHAQEPSQPILPTSLTSFEQLPPNAAYTSTPHGFSQYS